MGLGSRERLEDSKALNRKSLGCLEKIVGRNRDAKGDSDEGSEKREESCSKHLYCLREYLYF